MQSFDLVDIMDGTAAKAFDGVVSTKIRMQSYMQGIYDNVPEAQNYMNEEGIVEEFHLDE